MKKIYSIAILSLVVISIFGLLVNAEEVEYESDVIVGSVASTDVVEVEQIPNCGATAQSDDYDEEKAVANCIMPYYGFDITLHPNKQRAHEGETVYYTLTINDYHWEEKCWIDGRTEKCGPQYYTYKIKLYTIFLI